MPGLGVVLRELKKSNKPSKLPEMYKKCWFPAILDLKIAENAIFLILKST